MELFNVFKCQDCGNTSSMLTQDDENRMVCYYRELCEQMQELEKALD